LGGGINVSTAYLRQNRNLVLNFLNSDSVAMSYLYDETTRRLEKDLRANPESIRFHFDTAALDDPRAKQLSDKDF